MARQITKELARKIARKLEAKSTGGSGPHDIMQVSHGEKVVAHFGIRRGSEKDKGHDHVQKQLGVSTRFAKELANCTKSREQWLQLMIDKGEINSQIE